MAEGLCRHFRARDFDCDSAGIEAHGLNPLAVEVMAELGIDISRHRSKITGDLGGRNFDFVITVCGNASESCPLYPATTRILHHGFDDPPALARSARSPQAALDCYRRVRDEIRVYIENLDPGSAGGPGSA